MRYLPPQANFSMPAWPSIRFPTLESAAPVPTLPLMATVSKPMTPARTYQGPQRWPISVEAYHALGEMGLIPEKTELLHGQVYPKIPKSPLHRALLLRLLWLLQARTPSGYFVQPEQPLTLADSEPEPDLSVIAGSPEDFLKSHPATAELAVEICVSSYDYDQERLRAYAAAKVKEVWLVMGTERRVEVYRRPEAGRYLEQEILGTGDRLECGALPISPIALEKLFVG